MSLTIRSYYQTLEKKRGGLCKKGIIVWKPPLLRESESNFIVERKVVYATHL
jgi:hypothetical protein